MSAEQGNGAAAVAVSNRTVQLIRRYTGRGATQARTTIDRDHVVIVMRDSLSVYERTLAENGHEQIVLDARSAVQQILRPELIGFVEEEFGRGVIGFMSANQVDPDLAAEVFVLGPAPEAAVS
jgi:uncharacterized protein YbcI